MILPFKQKYERLTKKSKLKELQVYKYRSIEGEGYLCKPGNSDLFVLSEVYEDLSLMDDPVPIEYLIDIKVEYTKCDV